MVEVLGHVGEGFVAELTLVKGVCSVGLPAKNQEEKRKQTNSFVSLCHLLIINQAAVMSPNLLPVHDESHLCGEAIATVHTQVPGHA